MVSSFKLSNAGGYRPASSSVTTSTSIPAKKRQEKAVLVGASQTANKKKVVKPTENPASVIPFDDESDMGALQEF
jgi:hypothetical protein